MNVTLIGMPGSGKSFVGQRLADRLGYGLIELDRIMEERFKAPLRQIVDDLGDARFVSEQEKDAVECTASRQGIVISPGGAVIYSEKAMSHLKSVSKVVYLRVGLETVRSRIAESPRSIVGMKGRSLEGLYRERTALYEKWADIVVDGDRLAEDIIEDIRKKL